MEITVDIYKNRMVLSNQDKTIAVTTVDPFSTSRQLIGKLEIAEQCLKEGIEKIGAAGLFKPRPSLLIRPQELVGGGLSDIEERCFEEVGLNAGAKTVEVLLEEA